MGTIETVQQSVSANELTRRQAVKQWMQARSDGLAGGASGMVSGGGVLRRMWENPSIADMVINTTTAVLVAAAGVAIIVFGITSRRTIKEQGIDTAMEERNRLASEAKSVIFQRRKSNT